MIPLGGWGEGKWGLNIFNWPNHRPMKTDFGFRFGTCAK